MFILYLSSLLIFLSSHIIQITCQSNNGSNDNSNNNNNSSSSPVVGRVYPGCVLTGDSIYCYGGYVGNSRDSTNNYNMLINQVVALDLTVLGDLTVFDKSKIQWVNKSNTLNDGTPLNELGYVTGTSLSDGSILMYGGAKLHGPNNDPVNHNPFIHYDPQSNTWNNIALPNNTYTSHSRIVNIGNDKIWMWGGLLGQDQFDYLLNVYDYKMGSWPITLPSPRHNIAVDHTATLVKDLIYIVGGGLISADDGLTVMDFRNFTTYNTTSGEFNSFRTNGTDINSRGYHTTILTGDEKYLIIYGGARAMDDHVLYLCEDVYYVYNIVTNYLMSASVPGHPESYTSTRFGHYATLYKNKYMLLVFGYRSLNEPSNSIDVLNIQDPNHPTWVPFLTANNTSNSTSTSQPSGPDLKTIIPVIVVPVVVALLGIAAGLFFFIRHNKRKQKKAFVLEQQDPRRTLDHEYNNNDLNTEDTTAGKDRHSDSQNKDLEAGDPLIIYHHQYQCNDNVYNNEELSKQNMIKPSYNEIIKPTEKDMIKPFEKQ
ncbi:unnamed protein product [Cunninghamella echinulata]